MPRAFRANPLRQMPRACWGVDDTSFFRVNVLHSVRTNTLVSFRANVMLGFIVRGLVGNFPCRVRDSCNPGIRSQRSCGGLYVACLVRDSCHSRIRGQTFCGKLCMSH